MELKSGIKLLVEVVLMKVIPYNRPTMVDILLQDIHLPSGMVVRIYG